MSSKMQWIQFTWAVVCLVFFRDFCHISDPSAVLHGGVSQHAFIKSVSDANLVFEFLLSGLVIDADNNVALRDEEMASMKQGRAFLSLINDNVPKTVPAMEELLATLEEGEQSFSQSRFETLILGMIYSAYQVQEQDHAWPWVLGRLANVTLNQLRRF
ncbi:protein FAM180A [Electrophorus electricus]|uniref:protein FAM180A n=1 Tax=Electrophorus electricus TaxID=8005 RepID=UPI000F09FD46|nr:protein FAM180A [Electrophorus electricus]